jgi:Protein of unknown function (DUF2637)
MADGVLVMAARRIEAVVDGLPVVLLAAIAGAGSFTHIRDTAAQHGQHGPMSWAIAVSVDLTCVMAARERQRDRRLGIAARRASWPAAVLRSVLAAIIRSVSGPRAATGPGVRPVIAGRHVTGRGIAVTGPPGLVQPRTAIPAVRALRRRAGGASAVRALRPAAQASSSGEQRVRSRFRRGIRVDNKPPHR